MGGDLLASRESVVALTAAVASERERALDFQRRAHEIEQQAAEALRAHGQMKCAYETVLGSRSWRDHHCAAAEATVGHLRPEVRAGKPGPRPTLFAWRRTLPPKRRADCARLSPPSGVRAPPPRAWSALAIGGTPT